MPSHKKIVPKKRQSLHVWKQKETRENSTRKSDDVSQKTHCFLCNEGLIEVHPVGNSETTVIHGCKICQFRYLGIKDGELVTMYCIYCYQNFSDSENFQEHTKREHSCFLKNSSPDSIRLTRQNSCASDTTTVLSDTEAPSEESSLKRDDTIILEVLDDNVTKSDQVLITGSSSMERIPTIDLQALCQNIIGSQRSSMGKLASDDTIDRILPGFSMSLINLLQDDQVLVLNDPKQGASFQIRRTPSMSTPTVDINIVQETPSNSESDSSVQRTSEEQNQPPKESVAISRPTRKRRSCTKVEDEAQKKRGRHVEREIHKCPDCDKTFSRRYNLKIHRYVHSEQKKLECTQCKQQFKHVSLLRNHMRIKHEGVKPYKCDKCGQGFIQNNYLQRHMLLHTSEVCKCCNKKFETRREFNAHVRKVHVRPDSSKYCQACDETFVSLLELSRHLLGVTADSSE